MSRSGMVSELVVLVVDVLDAEEMDRCRDLSDIDKGQIIIWGAPSQWW